MNEVIINNWNIIFGKDIVKLYGHIHNNSIDERYDEKKHICVSLNKTEFKLVLLTIFENN